LELTAAPVDARAGPGGRAPPRTAAAQGAQSLSVQRSVEVAPCHFVALSLIAEADQVRLEPRVPTLRAADDLVGDLACREHPSRAFAAGEGCLYRVPGQQLRRRTRAAKVDVLVEREVVDPVSVQVGRHRRLGLSRGRL